jgi:prephenate dehydrogenase
MAVHLTIIGLGQIGSSVGLALEKHKDKITRFGHDREPNVSRRSQAMGAVDKTFFNLPASVADSGFVLLSLPFHQVQDTLKVIGPCLREGCVVMDTSPLKSPVAAWAKEFLPSNCYYVGLTPSINPAYLGTTDTGVEAAHADFFSKGVIGISAPPGTVGEALKLAADFIALLGADPFFLDLVEADGMLSALHLLPQVAAAALVNMAAGRAGWRDARKLAGRPFTAATQAASLDQEPGALAHAVLQGREQLLPVLDEYIAALLDWKELVTAGAEEKVVAWSDQAQEARSRWVSERLSGDWLAIDHKVIEVPKVGIGKRLFGDLGKLFSPPKSPTDGDKKK